MRSDRLKALLIKHFEEATPMSNQDKPTVNIQITADTPTAGAILKAVEELAKDNTVDSSGIKQVNVTPSDSQDQRLQA